VFRNRNVLNPENRFRKERKGWHLEVLPMRFKKAALLSGLTVLAGSIVVLPSSSVNRNTTTHYNIGTLQQTVRHRYKWRTARHYRRCRLQRKARSS